MAFIGALGMLGKILYLQFVTDDIWKAEAEKLGHITVKVPAHRGNILDAFGNPIASTVPVFDLAIDPSSESINKYFEEELSGLTRGLSKMFGKHSPAYYENKIRQARRNGNMRLLLERNISLVQAAEVKKLPLFKRGKYKGGLILDSKNIRKYPYKRLARRTIGYAKTGPNGKYVGLEGKFDPYLKGEDGSRLAYRSGGGSYVPASIENLEEPDDGSDIQSTLNMNYQDVAEAALLELLIQDQAHHGCVILMEVATGEIKAMVNLTRKSEEVYVEDFNYAVAESLEPGSTFKLPSIMAALEEGSIDLNDTIDTYKGVYNIHGEDIKDSHWGGFGVLTVQSVFEKSSNIGTARIIEKCFNDKQDNFIDRIYAMGLKDKTGIEISGERKPIIKHPDDKETYWSKVSLSFIAHGYEIGLAPIQILTFYNAVANNGKMVAPRLVKAIKYQSHLEKSFGTKVIKNSICSKETIAKAKIMLEGVVNNGTASNLKTPAYKIAGKTGTAVVHQNGGYQNAEGGKEYRASFVGYFPADKPAYSCIVVVSKPQGRYYGNKVAGGVFRKVADKVFATDIKLHSDLTNYSWEPVGEFPKLAKGNSEASLEIIKDLGIPYSKQQGFSSYSSFELDQSKLKLIKVDVAEGIIPDVTGMGLRDALPLLENKGLKVDVKGFGRIVSQSIDAGNRIVKGQIIELVMNLG